jgi:uncharacterized membrane protein
MKIIHQASDTNTTFFTGLVLIFIALGAFFRIINLEDKVLWIDEVSTAISSSGWTKAQVIDQFPNGQIFSPKEILKFKELRVDIGLGDLITTLSQIPEQTPLYYLVVRCWRQVFGSDIIVLRSLSVFFSLLTLPSLYLLCLQLFSHKLIGYSAICFFSISPFFIAYAQEARPYSFWLLLSLYTFYVLIHGIQTSSLQNWLIFFLLSTLNLYTSLWSITIIAGQVIYVLVQQQFCWNRVTRSFLSSLTCSFIAFSPWLLIVFWNWNLLDSNFSWDKDSMTLTQGFGTVLHNLSILVFDVSIAPFFGFASFLQVIIALCLIGLFSFSLIYCCRHVNKDVRSLLLTIIISPWIFICIIFLFLGIYRVPSSRYLILSQLGIVISVAYFFSCKYLFSSSRKSWLTLTSFLFAGCIISNLVNFDIAPEYVKSRSFYNSQIATVINENQSPLVIAEPYFILDLLSLSHDLKDITRLQILAREDFSSMKNLCQGNVFILDEWQVLGANLVNSDRFNASVAFSARKLVPYQRTPTLWKISAQTCSA